MLSNHLNICCLLFLPCLQSLPASGALRIGWPKDWSFSFSISPSSEYSGLISFRIDWFDLLAVQGTLKSLLQCTVQRHQFFTAWLSLWSLSHPYMTTEKTIAFIRRTFVSKVMSLLFKMLSRFVIAFLPRSKRLLISWLQSLPAVIFGVQKNKVSHCFYYFPIYLS